MEPIIKNLMKKGIVKGKSELLSKTEMEELEFLIMEYKEKYIKEGEVFQSIIGIDKRIDQLIEKILSNREVQSTLSKVMGENYLLWGPTIRFNLPNDKGLEMHQDGIGETGLMILVNDQLDGSTVFLPGSQLIPSKKLLANKVAWNSLKLMNIMKYFLMPARGNAGDYYYWFYRTWHGRTPGNSNKTKISIFFPFFPVDSKRTDKSEENLKDIDLESITQPTLKKMLSGKNYNSAVEIFEKKNNEENSLSMRASSFDQILKNKVYFIYTILKIFFLEILFFPITIKRFLSSLTKKNKN